MDARKVLIELGGRPHVYQVNIGRELLPAGGAWARSCLGADAGKIALISNRKVFGLYGEEVRESLAASGFEVCVWLMGDGEEYKNFESLTEILNFFGRRNLRRTDAVVALGGGVVGDLAGFAASVYLRGISYLQIPTTLLAMIDSSVGGKTGINTDFGKNLIGSFYQPNGVLVDVGTLQTLEKRELVAGFCEAVKQGAVGGRELFDETGEFLQNYPPGQLRKRLGDEDCLQSTENLLVSQISFKAAIVKQDEREETVRIDAKSRKILNFGHTTAHALEKITDYRYFKHGEAVGYGILVAGEISKKLEICSQDSIELLNGVVRSVGNLPDTKNIRLDDLLDLFIYDKKTIGKSLQWILLEDIGKPTILTGRDIPRSLIKESLLEVLHK
jgi:3-dehydroquinate synthase